MTVSGPFGPGGGQAAIGTKSISVPTSLDGVFVAPLGALNGAQDGEAGVTGVRLQRGQVLWSRAASLAQVGEAFFCADVPGLDGSAEYAEQSLRVALSPYGWPLSAAWQPVGAGAFCQAEFFVRTGRPGQLDWRPSGRGQGGSRGGSIAIGGARNIVGVFVGQQEIAALAEADVDLERGSAGIGYQLGVARFAHRSTMMWSRRIERLRPNILNVRDEAGAVVVDCSLLDPQEPLGHRIERYGFDASGVSSSVTAFQNMSLLWPTVHPDFRKRAYRYLYGLSRAATNVELPLLVRHDTLTGKATVLANGFGFGRRLSGPALVHGSNGAADDASCILLVTAFDAMRNESSLVIVDAHATPSSAVMLPLPACASVDVPGAWFPVQRG